MNRTILIIFLFFSTFVQSADSFEYIEHSYAELLLSKRATEVKLGAKGLYNDAANNLELVDIAAFALWQSQQSQQSGLRLDDDTKAWLIRAIAESESSRYEALVASFLEGGSSKKVLKYAKPALRKLKSGSEAKFSSEDVNVQEIESNLEAVKEKTRHLLTRGKFREIESGDPVGLVYETLGYPHKATVTFESRHRPWVGRVSTMLFQLDYGEYGAIVFDRSSSSEGWFVHRIKPYLNYYSESPEDVSRNIRESLLIADPSGLRYTAKRLYSMDIKDQETLDAVATRIWVEKDAKGKELADGLAWLCKVLGRSGDSRYFQFLKTVSKEASSSKLKRHAKKALKLLQESEVEQFAPEAV